MADADDVDDEFGEAASASASDAPAKASDQLFESLSESKTKLLLDDIDDEFGETTIDDVTAKTEAVDEVGPMFSPPVALALHITSSVFQKIYVEVQGDLFGHVKGDLEVAD